MTTLVLLSAALDASQAARDRVFMTCRGCGWQQHIRRSRCSHCGAAKVVATEPKRKKKRKRPSAAAAAAAAAAAGAAGELPPPPPGALSIVLGDDYGGSGGDGGDGGDGGNGGDGGDERTVPTTSSASGGSAGGGDGSSTTTTGQGHPPRRRPATVDVVVVPNKAAAEARIVSHVAHLSSMLGDAPPPRTATPAGRGRGAESACTPGTSIDDMSSLTLGWSASSEATASPPPSQPPPSSLHPAKRRAIVKVKVPQIGGSGDPPARWCGGPDVPGWEGVPLEPLLETATDTLDSWSARGGSDACSDAGSLPVAASPPPDCLLLPPASAASPRGVCDPVFEVLGADQPTLDEGGVVGEPDSLCGLFEPLPDLSGEPFF